MTKADSKSTPNDKSGTLRVNGIEVDRDKILAETALRPTVRAGLTAQLWSKQFGELDLTRLVEELASQANLATQGKLARGEAMLMVQAHTLDGIFNELARRAALNMGEYLSACETYLRLALKAQSQCRATLETLALMKNPPPTTFVQQANIAKNQQVNNGTLDPAQRSHARETENQPNKLLEVERGERLEFGAAQTTIGANPQLETVGTIDRAANSER